MKVGFISLGCNKNLVDTEKTISIFKENNYEIVNNPKKADIIVINTCGFIQPAKEEAINTILEMAEYKKQGCRYLIVMGCLVERYKQELEKEIPEVDLFIKYSEYKTLWSKVQELIKKREENVNFEEWQDRVITTGETTAYLKIADGCSNRCTYCAIPYIRGPLKSRKFEEKGEKGGKKLQEKAGRGLYWALFIFVGIPLPGTGAWTGTLAASLLDMDFKKSSIAVMAGVILAGIIMGLASAGVFGAAGAILGA